MTAVHQLTEVAATASILVDVEVRPGSGMSCTPLWPEPSATQCWTAGAVAALAAGASWTAVGRPRSRDRGSVKSSYVFT